MAQRFDPTTTAEQAAALVDEIRAAEDLKARLCARQAELTARLATLRPDDAAGLVAHARRESPARAIRYLGLAQALASELPHTRAALAAGALSEWRATLIARETACLAPTDRATVDEQLASPDPEGGYPFEGWGDRRLVAQAQRLVAALDPAAVVNRRSRAETDRHVTLRPAPDTMARLSVLLPAEQGVAAYATLVREADTARATGDPRSRGQVMADTLVERITGQARADAVPVTVNLVVSDQTLLAGGHEPAWLQGHGPIPADQAVELTRRATAEAAATLRRLYAAPATGVLVAMESKARAFPKALATFLDLRDRTCRTPWCDAPIRHHDHAADHASGGPTTAVNGQGLCERCNHTKQAPGWRARPITGPPGTPHRVETTLPTGHVVRSTAPPAPTPTRIRPTSRAEIYLTDLILEYAA